MSWLVGGHEPGRVSRYVLESLCMYLTRTKPKQVRYKGFAISLFRSENVMDAVAPAKYSVA